jgi:hypothetical protein
MTRRAQAHGEQMLASRLEAERSEKGGHSVDIHQGVSCLLSYEFQRLFREVTVFCLNIFKDRDQSSTILSVVLDDF